MHRLASTLLVLALLVGTAAAFAVTERLKLTRSPITRTEVAPVVFSPVCACPKAELGIRFRLRQRQRMTLSIVDDRDDVVRTLVEDALTGGDVSERWDGRDDAGALVPDGTYRPRVRLARTRQTITLPNPVRVDTVRPEPPRIVAVYPPAFSPDGDRRRDRVTLRYRMAEPAHGLLLVDGIQLVRTKLKPLEGALEWFGKRDGRSVPPGRYRLGAAAEDPAGNVSAVAGPAWVRVRYLELARPRIVVRARTRFGVRVRGDVRAFRWRLSGRTGRAEPGLLVLRAPRRPGRYTLYVQARGHGDRATVVVRRRGR